MLVRWFQFGAFTPIYRVHGGGSNTEIWNYGKSVEVGAVKPWLCACEPTVSSHDLTYLPFTLADIVECYKQLAVPFPSVHLLGLLSS